MGVSYIIWLVPYRWTFSWFQWSSVVSGRWQQGPEGSNHCSPPSDASANLLKLFSISGWLEWDWPGEFLHWTSSALASPGDRLVAVVGDGRTPLSCEDSIMAVKKHFQGNNFSLLKKEQSCYTWVVVRARNHEILLFIIKLARTIKS